jgi:hypothetical protein
MTLDAGFYESISGRDTQAFEDMLRRAAVIVVATASLKVR